MLFTYIGILYNYYNVHTVLFDLFSVHVTVIKLCVNYCIMLSINNNILIDKSIEYS